MSFLFGFSRFARFAMACLAGAFALFGHAEADELDILKGKTIRVIIGSGAGSTTDTSTRQFFNYLGAMLPETTIRVQNVPGAGGGKAIKELQDAGGSLVTLATFSNAPIYAQLVSPEVLPYDLTRLKWIGSLEHADRLLAIRSGLGGSSLDTLRNLGRQPIAPSSDKYSTSTIQAFLISAIFDLRMKVVTGTSDAQQEAMILAGDVDATVSNPPELAPKFESGDLIPVLKLSRSTVSEALKDVPALADVVPADVPKELVFFLESVDIIGRPIAAGPTTDPLVVAALRTAFDRAASNPTYVDAMAKLRITIKPTSGAETTERLEKIVGPAATGLKEVLESYLACGEKMSNDGASDCP